MVVVPHNGSDTVAPPSNLACKMIDIETFQTEERDIPQSCGPHDAIVCPKRTGICGSDMHEFLGHLHVDKPYGAPHVLGHECAGIVWKVGSEVKNIQPGDRVALEPGESCSRCTTCKSGHYNHCGTMKFASAEGFDGTLQGYYTLPADLCYKLPDNISLEEGAMMEPLSVAVNAVKNVPELTPTSTVVIFGAGPVGLLTMAVVKAWGAKRIIAVDVQAERLKFAEDYLAIETTVAVPPLEGETRQAYSPRHAEIIKEKFDLEVADIQGADIVFDCSGAEVCVQTGLWCLKRRGIYVQVGNGPVYQRIPLQIVTDRELNIRGVFRYIAGCYQTSIDIVSRGLVNLKPLATHSFPFAQANRAFEATKNGKGPDGKMCIKVIIEGPNGNLDQ